jgi:hypothetical protein
VRMGHGSCSAFLFDEFLSLKISGRESGVVRSDSTKGWFRSLESQGSIALYRQNASEQC